MSLLKRDPSGIRLAVSALTDVGRSRQQNQDRFLVTNFTSREGSTESSDCSYDLDHRGALLAVADGMGGAAAGDLASEMATDLIYEQLTEHWVTEVDPGPDAFARHVRRSVEVANRRINEESTSRLEYDGMGTTATVVGVLGANLLVSQVGDSRAYIVREGAARQVSRDQSYVQHLIDTGRISEEEAQDNANRNMILQALGPNDHVEVVQSWEAAQAGDVVLVCSDGLSGLVESETMAEVVSRTESLAKACRKLVQLANDRGGPDNITVVLARLTGDRLPSQ